MSALPHDPDIPQLGYLYRRDEVLQVMYWMIGEGIADKPTAKDVETFLGGEGVDIPRTLRRMAAEGYLQETADGQFILTDLGLGQGKRSFGEEFHELTHQAHGECAPDCTFCHGPAADPGSCPSKKVSHAAAG